MEEFYCPTCEANCRILKPHMCIEDEDEKLKDTKLSCGHCGLEVQGAPQEGNTFPVFTGRHRRVLIDKNHDFLRTTLLGTIGAEIVRTYWKLLKYNCYTTGYEQRMPELTEIIRKDQSQNAKRIRKMPDLVLYDVSSKKTLLLEVKTRPSEIYLKEYDLDLYSKYFPEAYIAFLQPSDPEIRVVSLSDLSKLNPKSTKNFGDGDCRIWEDSAIPRPYELAESDPIFRRVTKVDHEAALRHVNGALKKLRGEL